LSFLLLSFSKASLPPFGLFCSLRSSPPALATFSSAVVLWLSGALDYLFHFWDNTSSNLLALLEGSLIISYFFANSKVVFAVVVDSLPFWVY